MWTCLEFGPMKIIFWKLWANENLIMACLRIYWEPLYLATFPRVHSNSKEATYLSWQNTYPNLKTTCHIKLIFFLRTKLLQTLLLGKYLIPVASTLMKLFLITWTYKWSYCEWRKLSRAWIWLMAIDSLNVMHLQSYISCMQKDC